MWHSHIHSQELIGVSHGSITRIPDCGLDRHDRRRWWLAHSTRFGNGMWAADHGRCGDIIAVRHHRKTARFARIYLAEAVQSPSAGAAVGRWATGLARGYRRFTPVGHAGPGKRP